MPNAFQCFMGRHDIGQGGRAVLAFRVRCIRSWRGLFSGCPTCNAAAELSGTAHLIQVTSQNQESQEA